MKATISEPAPVPGAEVIQFAERALVDFGLRDEFELRSPQERRQCLRWLTEARSSSEEENRVSSLLDALWFQSPLPGSEPLA